MRESIELKKEMMIAQECARAAGAVLRDFYERGFTVQHKQDQSPVTDADHASERTILSRIKEEFPYSIVAEESGRHTCEGSDYTWFVDPLDGTRGFVRKTGDFSVVIGLAYQRKPILGIVYIPLTDEMIFAQQGIGAFLQKGTQLPVRLHVSRTDNPSEMKAVVSNIHVRPSDAAALDRMGILGRITSGSMAKRVCLVARGDCDVYVNTGPLTSEWDTCAPEVILQEAGGTITDIDGEPFRYCQENVARVRGVFGTNGAIHNQLIQLINATTLV